MEQELKRAFPNMEVELPSYINDIIAVITALIVKDIDRINQRAAEIINGVVERHSVLLESVKQKTITFRRE